MTKELSSGDERTGRTVLLVTVKEITSLVALDLETGEELGRAETGFKPHELVLSADHKLGFISIYGSADYGRNEPNNELGVIDLETMTEIERVDLGLYRAPHGLARDFRGLIWVTVEENQSVLVIDPTSRAIEQTVWLEVPVHFSATSPDRRTLYFSHKEYPFLSVVDAETRSRTARLPLPRGAQGIAVSPDGGRLYAGDFNESLVHIFDCENGSPSSVLELTGVPGWPYPTPDGRYLAVTTYNEPADQGFVEIFSAGAHDRIGTVTLESEPFHALAAPDGDHIYVACGDGSIPKIDLAKAHIAEQKLKAGGTMPEALAIVQRK
jgi:DNA-binding beta-propeller fold protein YncE